MLVFENDYSEGAHQKVLERLLETNMEQLPGYGADHYAARKRRYAFSREERRRIRLLSARF